MRRSWIFALALLAVILVPTASFSQSGQMAGQPSGQMEGSRSVAGGGVAVSGWTGKIDAKEEAAGMTLNSAKLVKEGKALHVTTGPAVTLPLGVMSRVVADSRPRLIIEESGVQ